MLTAEINGKAAKSPNRNNVLVTTGIIGNKRANIFLGNGFKEGETVSGLAYVEENPNFVPTAKNPDVKGYNLIMFVSKEAEEIKLIQQKATATQKWAEKAAAEAQF